MSAASRLMWQEIKEAPGAVLRQTACIEAVQELAARLRRKPPIVVVTCARGSSAHAAAFGKHLFERYIGLPVAAAAPSVASVYHRELHLKDQLFLAISQSGRSDDLVEMTAAAKKAGAVTAAILNDTESPLAEHCDLVLPMCAGPEVSVAATKTFIASLSMLLRLTAAWTGNTPHAGALDRLPERLEAAAGLDWTPAMQTFAGAASLITIGRGPTLAIAREAALKLKETCNLHAEAFSGAEFLHGPVALVSPRYPVLMFGPADEAAGGMRRLAVELRRKGAALFDTGGILPALAPAQAEADAVCLIQAFYALAVRLANERGVDAANPRHLNKITRTT